MSLIKALNLGDIRLVAKRPLLSWPPLLDISEVEPRDPTSTPLYNERRFSSSKTHMGNQGASLSRTIQLPSRRSKLGRLLCCLLLDLCFVFTFKLTVFGLFVWDLGTMDGIVWGIHLAVPSPCALLPMVPGDGRWSSGLELKEFQSKLLAGSLQCQFDVERRQVCDAILRTFNKQLTAKLNCWRHLGNLSDGQSWLVMAT